MPLPIEKSQGSVNHLIARFQQASESDARQKERSDRLSISNGRVSSRWSIGNGVIPPPPSSGNETSGNSKPIWMVEKEKRDAEKRLIDGGGGVKKDESMEGNDVGKDVVIPRINPTSSSSNTVQVFETDLTVFPVDETPPTNQPLQDVESPPSDVKPLVQPPAKDSTTSCIIETPISSSNSTSTTLTNDLPINNEEKSTPPPSSSPRVQTKSKTEILKLTPTPTTPTTTTTTLTKPSTITSTKPVSNARTSTTISSPARKTSQPQPQPQPQSKRVQPQTPRRSNSISRPTSSQRPSPAFTSPLRPHLTGTTPRSTTPIRSQVTQTHTHTPTRHHHQPTNTPKTQRSVVLTTRTPTTPPQTQLPIRSQHTGTPTTAIQRSGLYAPTASSLAKAKDREAVLLASRKKRET